MQHAVSNGTYFTLYKANWSSIYLSSCMYLHILFWGLYVSDPVHIINVVHCECTLLLEFV